MMPRPMKAITPPIKIIVMAMPALPEDRPTPMKIAPISVMMLAIKRPYILSMSHHCDIERGYQGFLYISFGFFLYEGHQKEGDGFFCSVLFFPVSSTKTYKSIFPLSTFAGASLNGQNR